MKTISNLAAIFGVCLLIVAIGTSNSIGICAAALLLGLGTAGVIKLEVSHVKPM